MPRLTFRSSLSAVTTTALGLTAAALLGVAFHGHVGPLPSAAPRPAPVAVPAAAVPSTAPLATCRAALVPGQVPALDLASPRCLDGTGAVQVLGAFACADGGTLVSVDGTTGAPAGWYHSGQAYRRGQAATDPAYRAAYATCVS